MRESWPTDESHAPHSDKATRVCVCVCVLRGIKTILLTMGAIGQNACKTQNIEWENPLLVPPRASHPNPSPQPPTFFATRTTALEHWSCSVLFCHFSCRMFVSFPSPMSNFPPSTSRAHNHTLLSLCVVALDLVDSVFEKAQRHRQPERPVTATHGISIHSCTTSVVLQSISVFV